MNIASLDILASFHGISTVLQQTNYTALQKVSLQWYLLYRIKFHHIFLFPIFLPNFSPPSFFLSYHCPFPI